jgi:hypothetical protein
LSTPDPGRFDADTLARLADAREVEIETAMTDVAPRHRTVIWVVVDPLGRVLIRSYRGAGARWFREALAHPHVTLLAGGREVLATATLAPDEERIRAASHGFQAKYARDSATPAMLRDEVLATTLELVPR